MANKFLVFLTAAALALTVGACKKKEDQPITQPQTMQFAGEQQPGQAHPIPVRKGETEVVVPDSVKGQWTAVTITVEDKAAGTEKDVTIKLGDEYTIPGSSVKVKVGEFLPDFRMQENVITSNSDEPNNPAVRVTVYEGPEEIFKGWLYSKFPAIHPFQHSKYGLLLKEGVKKG
ncbi:MAG: DUF2155 domain-containing protein [Thermodesulfovibrionales bacterium]